jgi:hypothetical protein
MDAVWARIFFGELKIVDVNIRRLRIKLEENRQAPRLSRPSGALGTVGERRMKKDVRDRIRYFSITKRWLISNLGFVIAMLVILETAFIVSVSNYYYSSRRTISKKERRPSPRFFQGFLSRPGGKERPFPILRTR